ncbi:MAG: DUF3078 domain-containing protein [Weeksellaceae bacterium]|jgi:hypothetical protein|nr:DUF3078 domain-containing protein [Weeksellaceae bacterium]MDX9705219.1 DUF3078 domain-containing protein [Weeksellaceae bacterium]
MKKFGFLIILLSIFPIYAQTVDGSGNLQVSSQKYIKTKSASNRLQGWYISGNNTLQFNQAAFSYWMAGGVNSYSLVASVDYEFNFTKGRHIWDNRILLNYGVLRNEGEDYRKSNDVIDLTSSYGYEFVKHFYFAASTNFKTQFSEGWDYGTQDEETGKYKKISNFMAPAYLSFGIGVDYKPNDNLQLNFHPFTSRFVIVMDKDFQYKGSYGLKEDGDKYVHEFGAFIGARYKLNVFKNISYDSRLGIYTNYLKSAVSSMDFAYQGVLDMKVNSLISAQATVNIYYNENQIKRTQLKQTFGVGISYKFNNTKKLQSKDENLPPPPTLEELQHQINEAQSKVEEANKNLEEAQQKFEQAQSEEAL